MCIITNDTNVLKFKNCGCHYLHVYNVGATKSKELSPGEVEPADTLEGNDESPNDTGTAIKNPASREPTPQLRGQIKKRWVYQQQCWK